MMWTALAKRLFVAIKQNRISYSQGRQAPPRLVVSASHSSFINAGSRCTWVPRSVEPVWKLPDQSQAPPRRASVGAPSRAVDADEDSARGAVAPTKAVIVSPASESGARCVLALQCSLRCVEQRS